VAGLSAVANIIGKMAMKAAPKAAPRAMPRPVQQARPTEIIEDTSKEVMIDPKNMDKPLKDVLKITDEEIEIWKDTHGGSGYKDLQGEELKEMQQSVRDVLGLDADFKPLKEGPKKTIAEHEKVVSALKPIKPWTVKDFGNMVGEGKIPSNKEIAFALRPGNGKLFTKGKEEGTFDESRGKILYVNDFIKDGEITTGRLDIWGYIDFDKWIITLKGKGDKNNNIYSKTGYFKRVGDTPVKFDHGTLQMSRIGTGQKTEKFPKAVIKGGWVNHNPEELIKKVPEYMESGEWVQVGYDPRRHGTFYTRTEFGNYPAFSVIDDAEEVIQVGPLVLAKRPNIRAPKEGEYKRGGMVARNPYPEARGIY
tara:strand:+ start:289 stop:1380 length:1092 start_codon:yes stop_codon:yes gene_type:complete